MPRQGCRTGRQAVPPNDDPKLSINFMPNAVYEPNACIRATLQAARSARFSEARLMFEFTENEKMRDIDHVRHIIDAYRRRGFTTAIDDFGLAMPGWACWRNYDRTSSRSIWR